MTLAVTPRRIRRIEAITAELVHLAAACDVSLDGPATIERIIRNDATVCGRKNEIGFKKLRIVIIVIYVMLDEYIERLGAAETRQFASPLVEYMHIVKTAHAAAMPGATRSDRSYTDVRRHADVASAGN